MTNAVPKATPPARIHRPEWAVFLAGTLVAVMVLASALAIIWLARQAAIDQTMTWATSNAKMLAEQARQSIKSSDLVLRAITETVQDAGIDDEASFTRAMSGPDIYEKIRQRAAGVPQIDVATIVDNTGQVVSFTRWWPPLASGASREPINLADRDYFQAHRANPNLDVYLSAPVQNRGTGTWTFYLSRKIRGKSGQMLGLALTGLHVEFFADFYQAVSGGSSTVFQLLRDDGVLIARYPAIPEKLGQSFRSQTAMSLALRDNPDGGAALATRPRLTDPTDQRQRIVSTRRVREYPLLVTFVVFDDEFLAQWRQTALEVGVMGGLLAMIIMGLTWALARLLARQHSTMQKLAAASRAAELATQSKSDFLAMMSHEIRTPINAVIGMSDILAKARLPVREQQFAKVISDSGRHLLSIITDILDFSRLEARQDDIVQAPFDLNALVERAMALASGLPGAAALQLSVTIGDDVPAWLIGDANRINQVLLNLLGNAVKFTDQGSIQLSITAVPGSAPAADGLTLRFTVTDTGTGVPSEYQGRLFEAFEQADSGRTRKAGGTGLGLAISKRIVALLGGQIGMRDAADQGSVFWFELPLQRAEPPVPAMAEMPAPLPGLPAGGLRVLVVDDTRTSQMVAALLLESLGHTPTIVENGAAALEIVQQQDFDVVLMDMRMPEMDGREATQRIRALGGHFAALPIIGLSADALDTVRDAGLAAGMTDYLTKPIQHDRLATALQTLGATDRAA